MVPNPIMQNESIPYPISDSARLLALEAQVARHESVPLRYHLKDMADAERRIEAERDRFLAERDRRYSEVAEARAEALKIKQVADEEALRLARELQVLKDARADEIRDTVGGSQGNRKGRDQVMTWVFGSGIVGAVAAAFITYFITRH